MRYTTEKIQEDLAEMRLIQSVGDAGIVELMYGQDNVDIAACRKELADMIDEWENKKASRTDGDAIMDMIKRAREQQ